MQALTKQLFHTVPSVARRWGVSPFTVRRMLREGKLKSVRLNRRRLIHSEEIRRVERGKAAA
jgi:excisionase family DNA binding protein